jgi:2-polyprenyl-3-methyl-5-hydroxy-6-metoxy-1,4-benzoquinol methylase
LSNNKDQKTVEGFGDEWERFDQSQLNEDEHRDLFNLYFSIFPWEKLPENSSGFDMGCGSGRWAKLLAPKVGTLHCIDPSSALEVAKRNLSSEYNCVFHAKGVSDDILPAGSQDFGVSLGVLHHIPDTLEGIKACTAMLKPGAPFLLYLYYAFDNRPVWFRLLWQASNILRIGISALPHKLRYFVSQIIASLIYWPLARLAVVCEKFGASENFIDSFPLSNYRSLSFYTMRTDALDRFGTRLEQRFTKSQIKNMMESSGLEDVAFSNESIYWLAVGYKEAE